MPLHREDSTTNEMRHDWLADRWVIVAPQRTQRPNDFVPRPVETTNSGECPFCHGREKETPNAVACYRSRNPSSKRAWNVRVVPNKFPAVNARLPVMCNGEVDNDALFARHNGHGSPTAPLTIRNGKNSPLSIDLFRRRDLTGGHEVIVESPLHLQSISQLDRETTQLVFTAYRDRLDYWLNQCASQYAVVFKNVGLDAGASLSHTHSQLIATDILPPDVERSVERMKLYFEKESACLFCRMAEDELEQKVRVVEQTPDFVAFCPFASRLPSMVTVLPKRHQSGFDALKDGELEQLSWLTHRLIRRVERCYPEVAYNFVIHTAPGYQRDSAAFHWRLELFPRLTKVAGFEWGSDCFINPLAPESAALALRRAGV